MPFDVFQSRGGPNIQISLFGDAAQKGAQLGKEIPDAATSAITGLETGYKEGLQNTATEQQNEIRQNQVDQIPVANEIQAEQLKAAQTQDKVAQLGEQVQEQTNDNKIQATNLDLQNKITQATKTGGMLKAKNDIASALATNDPDKIASIFQNPSSRQLIIQDPAYANSVVGQIIGNEALPKELQQQALSTLSLSKQLDFQQQNEKINAGVDGNLLKNYHEDIKDFKNSTVLQNMSAGMSDPDAANRLQVFPKGLYGRNLDGTINKDAYDPNAASTKGGKDSSFEVYKDGKYLQDVDEDDADSITKFKNAVNASLRMNARNAGIYTPGWKYQPNTGQPAPSQQTAPQTQSQIPTFQAAAKVSDEEQDGPTDEAPIAQQKTSPTNDAIVAQAQKDYAAIAKNPPPGVNQKMLDDRLIQKKQAIQQAYQGVYKPSSFSVRNFNPSNSLEENTSTYASPSEALSAVTRQSGVQLVADVQPSVTPKLRSQVESEPLLQNEPPIIKGIAAVESGGKRAATSDTGVNGLLQVTKATAAQYGLNRDIPEEGLLAGKLYLTDMLYKYNGNIKLALAAFNAGPGTVSDAVRHTGSTDWEDVKGYLQDHLSSKKFKEVKDYPDKVLSYSTQFMKPNDDGSNSLAYLLDRNGLIKGTPQQSEQPVENI